MPTRLPRIVLPLLPAALALTLAAPAAAKNRTLAPPGNSAIGQYVESVPTASGSQPTNSIHPAGGGAHSGGSAGGGTGGGGPSSGAGTAVSAATLQSLASHGSDGQATAALARATAPTASTAGGSPGHGSSTLNHGGSSGSPFSAVLSALGGSSTGGGLGVLLPIILIGTLLGAGALALLRRRRTA
jgi:hypothetical protein